MIEEEEKPVLRPLVFVLALCLLGVGCCSPQVPGRNADIDPVATQMAINTRVSERKTAAPTLTAEALRTPKPSPTPSSTPQPESHLDLGPGGPAPPQRWDSYRQMEKTAWDGLDAGCAGASGQAAAAS
jgi:hypothetical protein